MQNKFKEDPIQALREFEPVEGRKDKWVFRIIVIELGLAIILSIIGAAVLAIADKVDSTVITIFTTTASASIGATAGLLTPSQSDD